MNTGSSSMRPEYTEFLNRSLRGIKRQGVEDEKKLSEYIWAVAKGMLNPVPSDEQINQYLRSNQLPTIDSGANA